jgi:sporulation protein YlmC with PRC-barrel domain
MMLRSVKELFGYRIQATDGEIGKVYDFFFDDQTWDVRYLVVDIGGWLGGRQGLIIPSVLGQPEWKDRLIPVRLTTEQVKTSPDIDLDKPVYRQKEIELFNHYGWAPYWGADATGVAVPPIAIGEKYEAEKAPKPKKDLDPHLRSARHVIGYHIQAADGDIGHVEEFVLDDVSWMIRYMVVDTKNWLPGRKVLISPQWIRNVSWKEAKVFVVQDRQTIRNSPEYDRSAPQYSKIDAE